MSRMIALQYIHTDIQIDLFIYFVFAHIAVRMHIWIESVHEHVCFENIVNVCLILLLQFKTYNWQKCGEISFEHCLDPVRAYTHTNTRKKNDNQPTNQHHIITTIQHETIYVQIACIQK